MNQRTFYEVLATQLVDNTYDKINLRRRVRQEEEVSSSKVRPVCTSNGQTRRGGIWTAHLPHTRCKKCGEFAERLKKSTYVLNAAMLMDVMYAFATRRLAGIASYSTFETYMCEYCQYKVQRRTHDVAFCT